MNYSVYDLIRILLKKWWLILLCMCAVGAVSVLTSRISYRATVKNYETYTTETVQTEKELGTTAVEYYYSFQLNRNASELLDAYAAETGANQQLTSRDRRTAISDAIAKAYPELPQQLISGSVVRQMQLIFDEEVASKEASNKEASNKEEEPLVIANHISFNLQDSDSLQVIISDLEESTAESLIGIYYRCITNPYTETVFQTTLSEVSRSYIPNPPQYTEKAEFAQMVMQEPADEPPNLIRTVITAMIYGFVLTCFVILVVTFVKDTRPTKKADSREL